MLTLDPTVRPIQAAPHRYATPRLTIIEEALDKLVDSGQLVRVNDSTPWISNMVVRERPASATKPAKVRICLDPSDTINKLSYSHPRGKHSPSTPSQSFLYR